MNTPSPSHQRCTRGSLKEVKQMKTNEAMIALMVGATLALAAPGAQAQGTTANCAPHDAVVNRLATTYGESRQSIALGSNNSVIEVFASLETGTWTITVTAPGGPTCLVAAGNAYQPVNDALPIQDSGI